MSGRWLNPRRATAAVAAFAAVTASGVTSAAAHPFGDPQTVKVALTSANVVRVHWKVGGLDDLTLLGVALGLLPKDRVMLDGAVFFRPSDAAAVGLSRQFADYLARRITVTTEGTNCVGKVQPPKDVATTGALVDYTCPGPVGAAVISVQTLTDLDPNYETLATGPAGERAVYAANRPSHEWVLGSVQQAPHQTTGRSAAIQLTAVLGGVLLAAGAGLLVVRRWRRRAA